MANRFYIPSQRERPLESIERAVGIGSELYGLKHLGETLSLARKEHQLKFGEDGTEMIKAVAARREADIAAREEKWFNKPVNQGRWATLNASFKSRKLDASMEPLTNFISSTTSQPDATGLDLYIGLKRNLPLLRPQILSNLQKELETAMNKKDIARQTEISEWINAVSDDRIVDEFFPGVREYLTPEAVEQEGRISYQKLGGDIYKLQGGKSTLVQEGSKEEKIVRNMMRDPMWQYELSPQEEDKLYKKHERLLTRTTKKKIKPPLKKKKSYGKSHVEEGRTAHKKVGKKMMHFITENGQWVEDLKWVEK